MIGGLKRERHIASKTIDDQRPPGVQKAKDGNTRILTYDERQRFA